MAMLSPDDRHRMARTSASAAPDRLEPPSGTPASISRVAADASPRAPTILPGIELLRGFAALSVLVLHVVLIGQWDRFPTQGPLAWFRVGWLGVDIFFVISGLVVTLSVLRERDRAPSGAVARFLTRRAARILPLYLLTLLTSLVAINAETLRGSDAPFQVLTHVLLIHNLFPGTAGSIDGPNWSIGTEVQLYLMLALLSPWLMRAKPARVALAFLVLAMTYRWVAYSLVTRTFGIDDTNLISHFATQAPGMSDAFGLGIAMALLLRRGALPTPTTAGWFAAFAAGVAGLTLCQQLLVTFGPVYWHNLWTVVGFRSLAAVACALLVYAAVRVPAPVMQALPRGLTYLGTISYGIYLWHMPVLVVAQRQGFRAGSLLLVTLAGTLVLATASWELYERRWIARGRRWSSVPTHA